MENESKIRVRVGVRQQGHDRRSKSLVWGVFLIGLGAAFLLQRFGILEGELGDYWPLVFVAIAAAQLVDRRPGAAIMFLVLGAWFMACTHGWYGLTFRNSWSIAMIAVGLGMVVRALTGEDSRRRKEGTS